MLVQEAPDERQSESEAEGEATCNVKATGRFGLSTIARDRPIGEPFRLDLRKEGENHACYLYGRINGMRIEQITRTSRKRSRNFVETMDTLLEKVKPVHSPQKVKLSTAGRSSFGSIERSMTSTSMPLLKRPF